MNSLRSALLLLSFLTISLLTKANYQYSVESPYQTVISHLAFLEDDNYSPYVSAQTLGGGDYTVDQKIELAIKLKKIISKTEIILNEDSKKKRYKNASGQHRYQLCPKIPQIYLIKEDKEWKYSPETVKAISAIYTSLIPQTHEETVQQLEKDTISEPPISEADSISSQYGYRFNMTTPYHTARSYYYYLQDKNYHPEIAIKTIIAPNLSDEEKIALIIKYREVGDALNLDIEAESIPRNPDYVNEKGSPKYVLVPEYPEVALIKEDSLWYFSESTSEFVLKKHKEIYKLGTDRLTDIALLLKHSLSNDSTGVVKKEESFGFEEVAMKWKSISLIGLVLVLIIVFVLASITTRFILHLLFKNSIYHGKILPIFTPLFAFVLIKSFIVYFPSLGLDLSSFEVVLTILNVLGTSMLVVSIFRITDLTTFFFEQRGSEKSDSYKKGLMPFFGMFMKVLVATISTLLIIQSLGVDLKTFLTGLSIGGLTLALAAQDSLKNFFGSVMIFLDRPFQIGDWIVSDNISGDVESIGLRSTRIRTFHNSLVSVPNSKLADFTLDNMGKRHYRRFKSYIRISYNTPPDKIRAYTKRLEEMILEDPRVFNDRYHVFLNEYGKFGLEILFYVFFDVPTWHEELETRHDIMTRSLEIANELGIVLADPLQSAFFDDRAQ